MSSKNSKPFFSIIIPTYNGAERIRETLESISSQDISKDLYEVIIVDDASPSEMAPLIDTINKSFLHIINLRTIRCKTNRRRGGALNLGFSEAKGKYLLNIDDDDLFIEDSLSSLFNILTKHHLDVLMYDSNRLEDDKLNNEFRFPKNTEKILSGEQFLQCQQISWTTWHYAINRDFLIKNNIKFAENVLFEDVDFSLSLISNAKSIMYLHKQILTHVIRKGQITQVGKNLNKIEDLFKCAQRTENLASSFKNEPLTSSIIQNHAIYQYKIMLKRYVWRLNYKDIKTIIKKNKPRNKLNLAFYDFMYKNPSIFLTISIILKILVPYLLKMKKLLKI